MARRFHASCAKENTVEDLYKRSFKILKYCAMNIIKKKKQKNNQGAQIVTKWASSLYIDMI